MSSITPPSAEAIAKKLETVHQNVVLSALTALTGAVLVLLAAHHLTLGFPPVVTTILSALLLLAGAVTAKNALNTAKQFQPLPRSKEIEIQDTLARQSPEVREYLETAQRTRGGLVTHDLTFINEIAARKPSQVRPLVA